MFLFKKPILTYWARLEVPHLFKNSSQLQIFPIISNSTIWSDGFVQAFPVLQAVQIFSSMVSIFWEWLLKKVPQKHIKAPCNTHLNAELSGLFSMYQTVVFITQHVAQHFLPFFCWCCTFSYSHTGVDFSIYSGYMQGPFFWTFKCSKWLKISTGKPINQSVWVLFPN